MDFLFRNCKSWESLRTKEKVSIVGSGLYGLFLAFLVCGAAYYLMLPSFEDNLPIPSTVVCIFQGLCAKKSGVSQLLWYTLLFLMPFKAVLGAWPTQFSNKPTEFLWFKINNAKKADIISWIYYTYFSIVFGPIYFAGKFLIQLSDPLLFLCHIIALVWVGAGIYISSVKPYAEPSLSVVEHRGSPHLPEREHNHQNMPDKKVVENRGGYELDERVH